ncbi:hypothetical protein Droror1_Dr00012298 [Drosera rotundifolia]
MVHSFRAELKFEFESLSSAPPLPRFLTASPRICQHTFVRTHLSTHICPQLPTFSPFLAQQHRPSLPSPPRRRGHSLPPRKSILSSPTVAPDQVGAGKAAREAIKPVASAMMEIDPEPAKNQRHVEFAKQEAAPMKGGLPQGFFHNKDADLRARGIELIKPDIKFPYHLLYSSTLTRECRAEDVFSGDLFSSDT